VEKLQTTVQTTVVLSPRLTSVQSFNFLRHPVCIADRERRIKCWHSSRWRGAGCGWRIASQLPTIAANTGRAPAGIEVYYPADWLDRISARFTPHWLDNKPSSLRSICVDSCPQSSSISTSAACLAHRLVHKCGCSASLNWRQSSVEVIDNSHRPTLTVRTDLDHILDHMRSTVDRIGVGLFLATNTGTANPRHRYWG